MAFLSKSRSRLCLQSLNVIAPEGWGKVCFALTSTFMLHSCLLTHDICIQWLKLYFLMLDDRETRQRLQQRQGHRRLAEEREAQKGFASNLSPETRQAVIGMIDHMVTPLLVDQWRYDSPPEKVSLFGSQLPAMCHIPIEALESKLKWQSIVEPCMSFLQGR